MLWCGSGHDAIDDWIRRWLHDLPREGFDGWGGLANFASFTDIHAHPLHMSQRNGVTGVEMVVPLLSEGANGIRLFRIPVRSLSREGSPVSMTVWGPLEESMGEVSDLLLEERRSVVTAPATIDFDVTMHLSVLTPGDTQPEDVGYWYQAAVAEWISDALLTAEAMLKLWELELATVPERADLGRDLQRLAALRLCLPKILACRGPHTDAPQTEERPKRVPLTLRDAANHLQLRTGNAPLLVDAIERRTQASVGLVSQVLGSLQLSLAQRDSERQRRFQQAVAFLASAAVAPGAIAGWDEATGADIERWDLAAIMTGATVLTWDVLWLLLRTGERVRGATGRRTPPT